MSTPDPNHPDSIIRHLSAMIELNHLARLLRDAAAPNNKIRDDEAPKDEIRDAALKLLESLKTCSIIQWLPVSNPPDENLTVLVADAEGEVSEAYVEDGRWFFSGTSITIDNPVWWAEMPDSPITEE